MTLTDTRLTGHRATLDQALEAIRTRAYWSPHPEHPKAYGESAPAEGLAAFEALKGTRFDLDQPGTDGWAGAEISPYGPELGIEYPHIDPDVLLPAMRRAVPAWREAGPERRALVCLEILARISARTHEFAHAVMHTSGQAFMMAFQAGGPHAQDRGLEAVTYAYLEQTRTPETADWSKPQGKRDPLKLHKSFTTAGRGIALVIGCNTFPTWNGYPGLFASLATGNPVLVKPHPRAVLPLALTVRTAREVLAESGFDPNLVALAAEHPGEGIAKTLALRPEIKIIDYTGSSSFGDWLETHARQAQVYTEKAGVNTVLVDSTDDYRGMLSNLAFSLSLYSGQMCTTPQNLLIPRDGIPTDAGHKSYDEVVNDLAASVGGLLGDDARANALLGALVNPDVKARLDGAAELGEVALPSRRISNPDFPDAVVRTPVIVKVDAAVPESESAFLTECFGPVSFAVAVDSTDAAVELLRRTIRDRGAMTVGAYTVSEKTERAVEEVCLEESAQLSLNLTGGVYVNQTAAFSDLHGSGGNPAANAALCDGAFVANRFRVVEVRRQA
ncbi:MULTISPECIES: phenylacetic acid degradation protein PaaN [Streptomyces]|uniref:Phenylacetic acid degradation protein PaaN n=1 Tax=Streptomyces tsukubensis (strain DSM 42081 / NBRC 108919 / NRRL 18488 / 9993) TaxID=1114943 RepID=I2N288_STRT9|nr:MULTISPECIES: phenylacetic acid degradation protein PaaN [Streptomyces]AZK95247.1 phenylacetic acid degradation protein PaaN [Streptomyces tsukubensis]EIF91135.1 phenylacetic acid degradation protein paaN [Streptomyces tsukubensis NRRL18488]MYS62906.1 phenylacetic acid degradation protein PaaN [Streptomyces sp. SID5473]QKM68697.1 phenylacetic acid degradation protein PaaN [Streptomyces tsukubensis NRRL18488]TAI43503.1 phenylacetic acid degradation protein PaaN [Streptomyces tsukubensis]